MRSSLIDRFHRTVFVTPNHYDQGEVEMIDETVEKLTTTCRVVGCDAKADFPLLFDVIPICKKHGEDVMRYRSDYLFERDVLMDIDIGSGITITRPFIRIVSKG